MKFDKTNPAELPDVRVHKFASNSMRAAPHPARLVVGTRHLFLRTTDGHGEAAIALTEVQALELAYKLIAARPAAKIIDAVGGGVEAATLLRNLRELIKEYPS